MFGKFGHRLSKPIRSVDEITALCIQLKLTLGLTSRAVVVVEDGGRLVEVVEGRFGPAAAVDGALAVVVFLSKMEVVVVVEDAGRLVSAVAEPPAAAAPGRVLAAALGLVAPATGYDAYGERWRAK